VWGTWWISLGEVRRGLIGLRIRRVRKIYQTIRIGACVWGTNSVGIVVVGNCDSKEECEEEVEENRQR